MSTKLSGVPSANANALEGPASTRTTTTGFSIRTVRRNVRRGTRSLGATPQRPDQGRRRPLREVEHVQQAVRFDIASRHRLHLESGLDELEYRGELVHRVRHDAFLDVGGDHDERHTRPKTK